MRGSSVALAAIALLLAAPARAEGTFVINPQAGVNVSRLSTDPGDFRQLARVGWQIGGCLRLGERTYLQPGLFWIRSGTRLEGRSEVTAETIRQATDLQGLAIPAAIGHDFAAGEGYSFRGSLGASATIVTSVSDNDFGLTKDDFEKLIWGARAGVGLDLTRLSIDLAYDYGLSNVFKAGSDAKNTVLSLTVGLLLY